MNALSFDRATSLKQAVTRGWTQPVDGAALSCLPPLAPEARTLLDRHLFQGGKPRAFAVHTTPVGRIALIAIPREASRIYDDRTLLRKQLGDALDEAAAVGARVVSLTGLIPSATNLGRELTPRDDQPLVTTGHATTVSAIVMMLERALAAGRLSLAEQTLAVIGVGSIGTACLELALRVLPLPKRVILCDLFSAGDRLQQLAARLSSEHGVPVEVALAKPGSVPDSVYEARVMLGATNVPDVLDVDRLLPHTVVIDDSAPHCLSMSRARARIARSADLAVFEGGLLGSPRALSHRLYVPPAVEDGISLLIGGVLRQQAFAHNQIMGCMLSSALHATAPDLPRTLGPVLAEHALAHYQALTRLGFSAPQLDDAAARVDALTEERPSREASQPG